MRDLIHRIWDAGAAGFVTEGAERTKFIAHSVHQVRVSWTLAPPVVIVDKGRFAEAALRIAVAFEAVGDDGAVGAGSVVEVFCRTALARLHNSWVVVAL